MYTSRLFTVLMLLMCGVANAQKEIPVEAIFFRTSDDFYNYADSSGQLVKHTVEPKFSGTDHFLAKSMWNDKKNRLTPTVRDFWAARLNDPYYFNFSNCKKIQTLHLYVQFDIIGLVSAVIIPEDAPSYMCDGYQYTGFGLLGDAMLTSATMSGTEFYDAAVKAYRIVYIDREEPNQKLGLRGDLITRAKLGAMVKRHMPDSDLLSTKKISFEQVIEFFHAINRSRDNSFLECELPARE